MAGSGRNGRGASGRRAVEAGRSRVAIHWPAVGWAGLAAGIVSTLVQLVWWSAAGDFPEALFRDARLAAAIVMGPSVLPPPASFDAVVMGVATVVHFALSIAFAALLSLAIAGLRTPASLAAGAAFGLALYAVNLHGFTAVFPWFVQVRTWDTLLAHLVFGVVAALVYCLSRPGRAGRRGRAHMPR